MPTLRIHNDNENSLHFLTMTVIEWIDIFTKPEYFKVITDSFTYCRKHKGLLLYEYVILTNHVHFIARAKDGYTLSQIISDFKKHTTREIFTLLENDNRRYILNLIRNSYSKKKGYQNQIWLRENYPVVLDDENMTLIKVNYIYNNPVKKGYVSVAEDWLYSSARNRLANDYSILGLDEWE